VANRAEFEERIKAYKEGRIEMEPELAKEMKGYTELWIKGGREIYQVVD
jgi:hypothetical protein